MLEISFHLTFSLLHPPPAFQSASLGNGMEWNTPSSLLPIPMCTMHPTKSHEWIEGIFSPEGLALSPASLYFPAQNMNESLINCLGQAPLN